MTEGIELRNQRKIRRLGEKEIYKYLRILGADTIKQAEMKKSKKKTSGERENYSKSNFMAEISSKRITNWFILFVRYSRPFLNGPVDKKTNDNA